jgi:DNA polymerase III subunit delta
MSPAIDAKTLRSAVKSGSFAPAYYFHGDDDYLKDEEVRRIADIATDAATRDFNFELLRGSDVDAETLGTAVSTPPMMAERRVVVVRDVGALKKDARAMLDRYLARPASDLLLLLVSPAGAKADKALTAKAASLEFKPLTGDRVPKWIAFYAEHELKTAITEGAIALLQDAMGADLAQLKVELDKLVSYAGAEPINEAAVTAVVGVRPGETTGNFLDAMARRDATAALAMLPTVLQQPKGGAVPLVIALTVQMLGIGWAQAARERGSGVNEGKLSSDIFGLLKETGVYPWRGWGEFAGTCARASAQWSPRAIDDALDALLAADAALKGSRVSSDEQLLATLVLSLCGAAAIRRAA